MEKSLIAGNDVVNARDLEIRKVKALEKIARSLEICAANLEQVDLAEWDERIQWYLDMTRKAFLDPKLEQ